MTKIIFYSLLHEKLGVASTDIDGNCGIAELFDRVVKKFNADRSLFFKGKKIKDDYIVLLNGRSVTFEKNAFVKEADEVTIIPILTGG